MADNLPPAAALISSAQNSGLREEIIIDNAEMYLFGARRKWQA